MASIFLPHVSCRNIENAPSHTRISQESIHRAIRIEEDDDDLTELDNNDDSDPICQNSEDEARLDPEVVANTEKNDNKLESEINPEGEKEVVIAKHLSCCQIRSDILF